MIKLDDLSCMFFNDLSNSVIERILSYVDNHVTISNLSKLKRINYVIESTSDPILLNHLKKMELLPLAWEGKEPYNINILILAYIKDNKYLLKHGHKIRNLGYSNFYGEYMRIDFIENDYFYKIVKHHLDIILKYFNEIYTFWAFYIKDNRSGHWERKILSSMEVTLLSNYINYFMINYPILFNLIREITRTWTCCLHPDANFDNYFKKIIININKKLIKIAKLLPKLEYSFK